MIERTQEDIERFNADMRRIAASEPRYILTRMTRDRMVPKRYQRSGWMAFDRYHRQHGQVWPSKAEAQTDVARFNASHLKAVNASTHQESGVTT